MEIISKETISTSALVYLREFIADATTLTFREQEEIKNKMSKTLSKSQKIIEMIKSGKSANEISSELFNENINTFYVTMTSIFKKYNKEIKFQTKKHKFKELQYYLINGCQKDYSLDDKVVSKNVAKTPKVVEKKVNEAGETSLSERETEVLNLLLDGFSYTQIAEKFFISLPTVKTHINAIFGKKLVNSLPQLIIKEYKEKLTSDSAQKPIEFQNRISNFKEKLQTDFLFKPCRIKPLENYEGVITSLCVNTKGVEYQVRYYFNGEQKTEWFYDFEIEVLNADK